MNHVINSILENASTRPSIGHTNPALLHDVLWRALEHALKANTDDASHTPHARACLRIYAEIDTLSYLDKGDSKLAAALGKAFFESRSSKDVEAFWKLLLIKQLLSNCRLGVWRPRSLRKPACPVSCSRSTRS